MGKEADASTAPARGPTSRSDSRAGARPLAQAPPPAPKLAPKTFDESSRYPRVLVWKHPPGVYHEPPPFGLARRSPRGATSLNHNHRAPPPWTAGAAAPALELLHFHAALRLPSGSGAIHGKGKATTQPSNRKLVR